MTSEQHHYSRTREGACKRRAALGERGFRQPASCLTAVATVHRHTRIQMTQHQDMSIAWPGFLFEFARANNICKAQLFINKPSTIANGF